MATRILRTRGPGRELFGSPGKKRGLTSAVWLLAALGAAVLFAFLPAAATGANAAASLDQCANGSPLSSTACNLTHASDWVSGNVGASKATYFEGDSLPYRLVMSNLTLASHTVTIEWDTTKSSKHALDYLTTYNRTVGTANPCAGVSGCGAPTTFAIPADPQVTGAGVTPVAGNFTIFGGTITAVSAYSGGAGTFPTGDNSRRITITFTAGQANPVLAWAGHISSRADWGQNNSAVAISGSPYHTRLIDLDGAGGNQDRSLSAAAVIFPGSITITKDAVPNDAQNFSFTDTGGLTPTSFSLDDDADPTLSNTQLFSNITNFTAYTFTEGAASGWTLSFGTPVCTVTSPNGGTQSGDTGTRTLTVNLNEGENVSCTFTNTRQAAHLIVIKHVINDNGGTAVASAFTMTAAGTAVSGGTTSFAGAESPGTDVTVSPGSYAVTESGPSGYTESDSADCSGTIAAGETKTCTVTNDDQAAHLIVIKHVINDNGGTAVAADFTLDSGGTNDTPDNFAGAESPGTDVTLDAGSYAVTESGPSGYTESDSADCSGTIANGQTKTCTVTNDDSPAKLIVIKHVINDNGGTAVASDFTMSVTGSSPSPASFAGAESPGTDVAISPGSYSVSESGPSGYTESDSADCTGTIALGETKTCTVTNNDIPQVVGQITPTATTCDQFNSGTAPTLSALQYSVKSGKTSAVNPGVFFYWIKVTAVAGSNTFTINQAITSSDNNFNHFFASASGSNVFTSNCTALKPPPSINTSGGVTTVTFNASSAGTYIIGIKYNAKSVEGFTAPSPNTTVHYAFSTGGVPGSTQGLDLVKKP
jgi:hypothetical protein